MNKFSGKKGIMCLERSSKVTSTSERPFGKEASNGNSEVHAGPNHSPGPGPGPANAHGR